jgi:hypothetical protein
LKQVGGSVAPSTRKHERSLGTIVDARVKCTHDIPYQLGFDSEPVTIISLWTNRVSQIHLPKVVERHDIRIGDESWLVLVLDPYSGPGKDEAIVLDRTGILE